MKGWLKNPVLMTVVKEHGFVAVYHNSRQEVMEPTLCSPNSLEGDTELPQRAGKNVEDVLRMTNIGRYRASGCDLTHRMLRQSHEGCVALLPGGWGNATVLLVLTI